MGADKKNRRHVTAVAIITIFAATASLLAVFMETKVFQKNQSDWSKVLSATSVGEIVVNLAVVPRVGSVLQSFANRERYEFSARTMHPTESWLSLDLLSEQYRILITNPVHVERFKIYIYVNVEKGGTGSGANKLLAELSSIIASIS